MNVDILTIEVGSTITKANGFVHTTEGWLQHVAQGFAPTSVKEGDVNLGVQAALNELQNSSGLSIKNAEVFVNSSAAGGLRMTVHGLTYNMTARAAREASLGAGAIIKQVTAGEISEDDLEEISSIHPNIILLAGGVDFGARDAVEKNAEKLSALALGVPVIYAGNAALRNSIKRIFERAGQEVFVAPNVFPDVDVLNVDPVRKLIQEAFSKHIVHAPGMENLTEITSQPVIPTPGAVLKAAEIFAETLGDVLILDVGGATTDVHSVTEGSSEWSAKLVDPEPRAKRTVEGDLGVFVNAANVLELSDDENRKHRTADIVSIPVTESQREMTHWLCSKAVETAVRRHAAVVSDIYTPTGRKQIVKGKDLSAVKWVIGTGGALTRISGGDDILHSICTGPGKYLLPQPDARILLDKRYLFSAMGTIADRYGDAVRKTFEKWLTGEKFHEA